MGGGEVEASEVGLREQRKHDLTPFRDLRRDIRGGEFGDVYHTSLTQLYRTRWAHTYFVSRRRTTTTHCVLLTRRLSRRHEQALEEAVLTARITLK